MRRSDREVTDQKEIDAILAGAQVCRVALSDGNGPYIIPICFGYEPGALYLHSALEGRKIDMIRADPRCCFEIDLYDELIRGERPCSWGIRYRSIVGFGRATILEATVEKKHGLACIMRQYDTGTHEFSDEEVQHVAVIRIAIESMTAKKSG